MEPTEQPKSNELDIPQKIFTQLISDLSETTIPRSVADQLKKTIVDNGDFSEQSLRAALTPNPDL
jgi:hypothetical protein